MEHDSGKSLNVSTLLQDPTSFREGFQHPAYITLCGVLLVVVLFEWAFRSSRGYKLLKTMPGPARWPLVGNAPFAFGLSNAEVVKTALKYHEKFGDTFSGTIGTVKVAILVNPADIEIILSNLDHIEKAEEYRFFKPWFGDGLLISNGDHWRHHRKMIAPTFHQSILKSFVPKFVQHSRKVAEKLQPLVGQEIDVHHHMSQVSVEILLNTVMGSEKLPPGPECKKYAQAVVDMCNILHKRQVKLYYRYDFFYQFTRLYRRDKNLLNMIKSLTNRVVKDRGVNFDAASRSVIDTEAAAIAKDKAKTEGYRDDLDDLDDSDIGSKRRLALLDAMIDMSKDPAANWSYKDIVDEVNTIMFEGHDTTSAGSSFVLCMLGIHKDLQDKVYAEQRSIFGEDMQRDCSFADTLEMHYLERVIKETLRLYPPVPIIARKINREVKLASGPYTVPEGTTVVIGIYATHRLEHIYENPEAFNPDNFLPEKVSKRHYYSYVPFSAGPRSCVGRKYAMLMLKVLLSTLIRKYEIDSNRSEKDFVLQGDIILKLANGFKIILKPRK